MRELKDPARATDTEHALLSRAIAFAQRAHQGQFRKDGITPYAAHPMRVLVVMMRVFGVSDPEVLAAAVLHDTIEDTTTDRDDLTSAFGERVAAWVAELSKDKRLPEAEREARYFAELAAGPVEVKLLKLGDTFDNLADCASLAREQQDKAVGKARRLLELFEPSLSDSWSHVLAAVRQRIMVLESDMPAKE